MEEFKELSSDVFETQRLNDQIESFQKQKKDALEELGGIIYADSLQGTYDEEKIKKKCEAIREIDSQIKEKEERLQQIFEKVRESIIKLKAIAFCECGAELYEGIKFCYQCGKKVEKKTKREEKKEEKKNAAEKVCFQCGAQLSKDSNFCNQCGIEVKSPYL